MNQQQNTERQNAQPTQKDQGKLERLANIIDPAGRDVTDEDLKDPGSMTPDATPTENRS